MRAAGPTGTQATVCPDVMRKVAIYLAKKKANGDINRYYQPKDLYICNLLLIESINPKRFTVIVKI